MVTRVEVLCVCVRERGCGSWLGLLVGLPDSYVDHNLETIGLLEASLAVG